MISCFKGRFKVTSPRGYRTLGGVREYHGGLDLVALDDKTVYAVADGTVDAVPYEATGFGYYVRQKLPDGRRIYYGHMAKGSVAVTAGQVVKVGDKIGTMGATGRVTGAHTHIELRPKGTSKESLDIAAFTGIPNEIGTYTYTPQASPITSSNDLTWALNAAHFPIADTAGFIKALDKAKAENSPIWWGLYKLVNGIK